MKKILALFAVICMALFGLYGCGDDGPSQSATVVGTVTDTSLNAIAGASVTVGSVSSTTLSDGSYTLERASTGLQDFSVSASGYVSVSKIIDVAPMTTTYVPKTVLARKDSKSTDIGPGGGEVTNSDGSVKLEIPAGALSSDLSIVVTNCSLLSVPLPVPDGYKLVSLVYISPPETVLSTSATLSVPAPSENPVYFYWLNASSSAWDALGEGVVSSGTVSVSIARFGWVAAVVPVSSGSVSGKVVSSAGGSVAGADVYTSSHFTATDSSGDYTLSNLPAGTVSITASKTGYTGSSVSTVVQAGTTVTADNITISPVSSYGSVSGKILPSSGSGVISGARIVAEGKTSYSDSNGNYTISELPAGTVTVSVYAYGYVNQSASVSVTAGSATSKNFRLDAVDVSASGLSDDFETDKGFSAIGLWNRVLNPQTIKNTIVDLGYVTLPDSGYLPSAKSGNYCYWFGKSDTGSYIGEQDTLAPDPSGGTSLYSQIGTLESPSISLLGYSTSVLSFWTWWEVESRSLASTGVSFDLMQVDVSDDAGASWSSLGRMNPDYNSSISDIPYSSGGYNQPGEWVKNEYDLTPYVGKNIKIRFYFSSIDRLSNGFRGWLLDDFSVGSGTITPASR